MYQVQLKEFYAKQNDILHDVVEEKRPKKRKNAALAYFRGKFFLIGGKLNNTACKSVWIFDSNVDQIKLSTLNGYSSPNYKQHSSVSFNSCVYFFGGWNETLGISSDVTKFDPKSLTSSIVKCASKVAPSPRYGHSAVVYSSCMLIIGGIDNNLTCCSDMWMFNFLSSRWEEIKPASIRLAIHSHCAVLSNVHIIVTGGKLADDSNNEDCWIFSLTVTHRMETLSRWRD
uniref:Uncharacterized protein n=1 Tax=Romanomermis culicivorax TaxID=13658 RepID=A0A915IL73_ROMCU